MTTTLTKPVKREVGTRRVGRSLVVEVDREGLVLRGKGTRRRLRVTWEQMTRALAAGELPGEMPARFVRDPLGWLLEE